MTGSIVLRTLLFFSTITIAKASSERSDRYVFPVTCDWSVENIENLNSSPSIALSSLVKYGDNPHYRKINTNGDSDNGDVQVGEYAYPNFIASAFAAWEIDGKLIFRAVGPGEGTVKVYFYGTSSAEFRRNCCGRWNGTCDPTGDKNDLSPILGCGRHMPTRDVYVRNDLSRDQMYHVLQHEIGHAMGLEHRGAGLGDDAVAEAALEAAASGKEGPGAPSVMDRYYTPFSAINVTEGDRRRLFFRSVRCLTFDGISFPNKGIHLVFRGNEYDRIDYDESGVYAIGASFGNRAWQKRKRHAGDHLGKETEVAVIRAMYRSVDYSSEYVVEDDSSFSYVFDHHMNFLRTEWPLVRPTTAVLCPSTTKLRGICLVFSNDGDFYVFSVGKRKGSRSLLRKSRTQDLFNTDFPPPVKGAFETRNGFVLLDEDYEYVFDKSFKFIRREKLCIKFPTLHCCKF